MFTIVNAPQSSLKYSNLIEAKFEDNQDPFQHFYMHVGAIRVSLGLSNGVTLPGV